MSFDLLQIALNLFGGHAVDGLAGQCRDCSLGGNEALLVLHGGTGVGRIHELSALGHKTAFIRSLRAMHHSVFTLSDLRFAHAACADATSQLKQSGNAGGVAVCALVIGSSLMQCAKGQWDRRKQHGDNRQQREDRGEHALGRSQRYALDEQQHGKRDHRTEGNRAEKRHDLSRGARKLGAHLTGVIARHQDDLAATNRFAILRRRRGVFRHDVLAHAFPQELRDDGLIQILGGEQAGSRKAADNPDDAQHGHDQRQQGKHHSCAAADHARQMRVADPIEILDVRRQACFLLELLRNVQRSLLFLLGASGTGADFLRQVCDMLFNIRHFCAFRSSITARHIRVAVYAICLARPNNHV